MHYPLETSELCIFVIYYIGHWTALFKKFLIFFNAMLNTYETPVCWSCTCTLACLFWTIQHFGGKARGTCAKISVGMVLTMDPAQSLPWWLMARPSIFRMCTIVSTLAFAFVQALRKLIFCCFDQGDELPSLAQSEWFHRTLFQNRVWGYFFRGLLWIH